MPRGIEIAALGQTFMQHPQATHSFVLIMAFLFINTSMFPVIRENTIPSVLNITIRKKEDLFRDKVTLKGYQNNSSQSTLCSSSDPFLLFKLLL